MLAVCIVRTAERTHPGDSRIASCETLKEARTSSEGHETWSMSSDVLAMRTSNS